MADPVLPPDDDAMLAAELALGVLDAPDRAQAMRRRLADPAFAAEVTAWEMRLADLCDECRPVPPPAELWHGIEARVAAGRATERQLIAARDALRRWRFGALGAGAVAAGLALVLLLRPGAPDLPPPVPAPVPGPTAPAPVVIAELRGGAEGPVLLAHYQPTDGALRIRAENMPETKLVPELWVIPADGVPRSLGAVRAAGTSDLEVAVPHRKLMHDGATLAITMEPATGVPHDKPSAPPVAAGQISTI